MIGSQQIQLYYEADDLILFCQCIISIMKDTTPTTSPLTIGICSPVSQGKSSLVNALIGYMVALSQLKRSTVTVEMYRLAANCSSDSDQALGIIQSLIERRRLAADEVNAAVQSANAPAFIEHDPLPALHGIDMNIIDFPGINDSADSNDKFFAALVKHVDKCDILIYLTAADSAFLQRSEVELFARVQKLIADKKQEGFFIDLAIGIGKLDQPRVDLDDLHAEVHAKYPELSRAGKIFRLSAHRLFIDTVSRLSIVHPPIPEPYRAEVDNITFNAGWNPSDETLDALEGGRPIKFEGTWMKRRRQATIDCARQGDWDGLIDYLRDYGTSIAANRFAQMAGFILSTAPGTHPRPLLRDIVCKMAGFYEPKHLNKFVEVLLHLERYHGAGMFHIWWEAPTKVRLVFLAATMRKPAWGMLPNFWTMMALTSRHYLTPEQFVVLASQTVIYTPNYDITFNDVNNKTVSFAAELMQLTPWRERTGLDDAYTRMGTGYLPNFAIRALLESHPVMMYAITPFSHLRDDTIRRRAEMELVKLSMGLVNTMRYRADHIGLWKGMYMKDGVLTQLKEPDPTMVKQMLMQHLFIDEHSVIRAQFDEFAKLVGYDDFETPTPIGPAPAELEPSSATDEFEKELIALINE